MPEAPGGALYVMYGSLLSPLGQRQVLPYVRGLAERGVPMAILTFEPEQRDVAGARAAHAELASAGIEWAQCTYHPGSSLSRKARDLMAGAWTACRLARRRRVRLLHARSDLPALLGLLLKPLTGWRVLYDIRGLLADEYVDAGHWSPRSFTYRLTRLAERLMRRRADAMVVLTDRIRAILVSADAGAKRRPPAVIPCCVDTTAFSPGAPDHELAASLGLDGRPVLVYSGSLGTWYMPDEMLAFFASAREASPELAMLALTPEPPEHVRRRAAALGLPDGSLVVKRALPSEVPAYLRIASFGLSFIRASFSKQASSPTKIAEYLATGLPLCINAGVGDLDQLVERDGLGVLLRSFDREEYARAWRQLRDMNSAALRDRCRAAAVERFSLEEGVRRYACVYDRLLRG